MDDIEHIHITVGFQPIGDTVLIHPVGSGVPSGTAEWGDVVAVGSGRRASDGAWVTTDIAPGDRIALRPGKAVKLNVEGRSLAIVTTSDVLGVLLRPAATTTGPQQTETELISAAAPEPRVIPMPETAESLETDVAPELLDREAPTSEDLH
jgi:co-chaperonin GroES (HSP10)